MRPQREMHNELVVETESGRYAPPRRREPGEWNGLGCVKKDWMQGEKLKTANHAGSEAQTNE